MPASIALRPRSPGTTITRWLCDELRAAILEERLPRGTRLPGTRTFATQQKISRHIVVTVYGQLHAEGYLAHEVGAGTFVKSKIPEDWLGGLAKPRAADSAALIAANRSGASPGEFDDRPARPFHPITQELARFPMDAWTRVATRRLRRISTSILSRGELAGYRPLREAVAAHLVTARGVARSPDEIVIVSGIQQALDLLARILLAPGEHVWVEDPGYIGAVDAFRGVGAHIVPVKVDQEGFDPGIAERSSATARLAYVTPGHQFVLGATMSVQRRLELLSLARRRQAYIVEDDYDSEFRFAGHPIPALQSLDRAGRVIFVGSFNKVLFSSLRMGFVALPPALVEPVLRLRWRTDRYPPGLTQAVLCDFIVEGHFGRHVRRMRELYAARLDSFLKYGERYLGDLFDFPVVETGMNIPVRLMNGMRSKDAQARAEAAGILSLPLDRFTLRRRDLNGLLLGFAAFTDREIREGVQTLARALGS